MINEQRRGVYTLTPRWAQKIRRGVMDHPQEEMLKRLINIELKINTLLNPRERREQIDPLRFYAGHADQGLGHVTFAQFGEDFIVANIFQLLGIARPSYIDIGAHHPLNVSNTALLYLRGTRGINIEANPDLFGAFQTLRPDDINLNIGIGPEAGLLKFYRVDDWSGRNTFDKGVAEAFVREHPEFHIRDVLELPVETLDTVIRDHAGGVYPDFMSIDVEGWDHDILAAADFSRSRPKVICVEAVSGADTDDSIRLLHLLRSRGYGVYVRTIGNLIMVDSQSLQKLAL